MNEYSHTAVFAELKVKCVSVSSRSRGDQGCRSHAHALGRI